MRIEKDFLGEIEIPQGELYGIHSVRAKANFPNTGRFKLSWYKSIGTVKKACYLTIKEFYSKASHKYDLKNSNLNLVADNVLDQMAAVASEIEEGKYFDSFIVPAVSGGAGTSINLNVNEIITNQSLINLGRSAGDYHIIDPIEHANLFQSTNDVIPSSLKIAAIRLFSELETEINISRNQIEAKEKAYRDYLRIAYTQMQAAVPTSFGRLFSSYAEAFSRDWWRVSKCVERIKVLNMGGSAIGTGITVPRFFIMEITRKLQEITNLPLTRSENLSDATSNLDSFVEVHATVKAHAVNLEKMVNDLRLLSSDLNGVKELIIPQKQVGSSIMPGKVNPVVPEYVISCCHQLYANDMLISNLCAQGCLELNAYLPIIGNALLESLELLISCNKTLTENLLKGLEVNKDNAQVRLYENTSVTTVLVPYLGYNKAGELARYMIEHKLNIFEANKELELLKDEKLKELLKPENLLKEGFSLNDIL